MTMSNLEHKVNLYNTKRPFSGFLIESQNGFLLLERLMNRLFDYILTDQNLFAKAKETFLRFKDDPSFDKQWLDIIEVLVRKYHLELDPQQMHRAFKIIPMEFYNYSKSNDIL